MRRLQISTINPSTNVGSPSTFTVSGDVTQLFHGKEWTDSFGSRVPFYVYTTPPAGTTLLVATSFEVVENSTGKYNGRYTVFTKPSAVGAASSEFSGGITTIRVNETMPSGAGIELTSGIITNISTYLFTIQGEGNLLVVEQQNVVGRPIELTGNQTSGWGEVLYQNMLKQAQSFASSTAPFSPYIGQLWYDTSTSLLKICKSLAPVTFVVVNQPMFGPFRHTQSTAVTTWTITHNLGLVTPFICTFDIFVDIGGGVYKPMLPSDVTFTSANAMTVSFSTAHTGFALVRA
jgi:hypothetical protein